MTLEVKIWRKYRGIYAVTECDLLCQIVPKVQYAVTEGHCSIQLEAWGAVSPLADPGQSAGGGEAPGSSEKFAFYNTKKRPKNTCVVHFLVS